MSETVTQTEKAMTPPSPKGLRLDVRNKTKKGFLHTRAAAIILPIAVFIAGVAIVEVIVIAVDVSPTIFPRPSRIGIELYELFVGGTVYRHLWTTTQEIALGFVLGASLGFVCGLLVAESRLMRIAAYPYIVALQAMPLIAVAPLFLIWFGYGMTSKVVMALTITFFPVLVNTAQGLASASPDQIRLLKAYGASPWQILRRVKLPAALPAIFAGLEMSVILAVIGAIVAEFVGSNEGLGYLILLANGRLDTAMNLAVVIILSALGVLLSSLIRFIRHRTIYW